jgi:hypothetical protein
METNTRAGPHGGHQGAPAGPKGTITVEVAERSVTLDSGDAVAFPGVVAHSYANPGAQPARFSLAVFEPGVGSGIPGEAVDA